jgi:tripartite-type tricarboxylate transporter receptor subunit TctC
MVTRRVLLCALLAAAARQATAAPALAQTYPTRTVKIIVPFQAGSTSDAMARLVADKLTPALGQSVIVENRPGGAGGSVGANAVTAADPDGYTLLVIPVDALTTALRLANKNLNYDPAKNFAPVALFSASPFVINVNAAVPVKTLAEFAAYAEANAGRLSYGSPGYGTYPHLLAEMLGLTAGAQMIHVPYRGGPPLIADLLAGQLQLSVLPSDPGLVPHFETGKLKALAVTSEARSPYLPGVPTTAEAGFPQVVANYSIGLFAPAATPASIIDKLNAAVNDALRSASVQESLKTFGAEAKIGTPQDFAAYFARVAKASADMMAAVAIKVE